MRKSLKPARPGHQVAVGDGIGDGTGAISHCLLDLCDHVRMGALDLNGAREGVLHPLHEGVSIVTQRVLCHTLAETKAVGRQVLERIDLLAAAREHDALHVAALCAAEREDAIAREHIECEGVDAFLVHDEKRLARLAHFALEVEDQVGTVVHPLALCGDHLLALLRAVVVEAGVHLRLLVLEVVVEREDVRVLQLFRHSRVPTSVIHDQSLDELRVESALVHHVHHLNHVEVQRLVRLADAQHRVHYDLREQIGELHVHLRAENALRDLHQQRTVERVLLHLHAVDELEDRCLGEINPVAQKPRVHTVRQVALRLPHQLADDQDGRRRAVSSDVVLRRRDARDHHRRGVLDLHLVQQRVAILRQLDVPRSRNEHLQRPFGSQVGLEDVLQAARRVDVHLVRYAFLENLCIRVDCLCTQRRHLLPN
mmetsp:Transcript_8872/g.13441  ORF Transcript_8872/g.13441 Transcript_8872/m.13441 type:complete len:426 (+) Transcript_8872:469-1746(+)